MCYRSQSSQLLKKSVHPFIHRFNERKKIKVEPARPETMYVPSMSLLDMKLFILSQIAQIWFFPLKLFILVHRPDEAALTEGTAAHTAADVRVETALAQRTASADKTGQDQLLQGGAEHIVKR